jgi:hypothetical protein
MDLSLVKVAASVNDDLGIQYLMQRMSTLRGTMPNGTFWSMKMDLSKPRAEKGGSLRKELVLPYKFGFGGIKYDLPSQNAPYSLFGVQCLQFLPTVAMTEEFLGELCKSGITLSAITSAEFTDAERTKKSHTRMTIWVDFGAAGQNTSWETFRILLTETLFL